MDRGSGEPMETEVWVVCPGDQVKDFFLDLVSGLKYKEARS